MTCLLFVFIVFGSCSKDKSTSSYDMIQFYGNWELKYVEHISENGYLNEEDTTQRVVSYFDSWTSNLMPEQSVVSITSDVFSILNMETDTSYNESILSWYYEDETIYAGGYVFDILEVNDQNLIFERYEYYSFADSVTNLIYYEEEIRTYYLEKLENYIHP